MGEHSRGLPTGNYWLVLQEEDLGSGRSPGHPVEVESEIEEEIPSMRLSSGNSPSRKFRVLRDSKFQGLGEPWGLGREREQRSCPFRGGERKML